MRGGLVLKFASLISAVVVLILFGNLVSSIRKRDLPVFSVFHGPVRELPHEVVRFLKSCSLGATPIRFSNRSAQSML